MTRLDDRRARACAGAVAVLAPGAGIQDAAAAAALLDWDTLLERVASSGHVDAATVRTALLEGLTELALREPWICSTAA